MVYLFISRAFTPRFDNLVSANQNPEVVSAKRNEEIAASRIAEPFDHIPFPHLHVLLYPKKFRVIFG